MADLMGQIKHVILDIDGTLCLGRTLLPRVGAFLETLVALKIGRTFVTNNNSRSRAEHVEHLGALGIDADISEVHTSGQATIELLRRDHDSCRRLCVLGASGFKEELVATGFELAPAGEPDAVVVGFDTSLNYPALCEAAKWIAHGKPYIATHPDRVCPTDEATVLPDCGAICALLESATGRAPDAIAGKPNPHMILSVLTRHGVEPHEAALVGDRLYTDIRMANRAGVYSVLVLTGETGAEQLTGINRSDAPALVVDDLGVLSERLSASRMMTHTTIRSANRSSTGRTLGPDIHA